MASYAFERGFWDGESSSDDADDESGVPSEAEAGELFADALLLLKLKGKISARDVCVLSYYGKLAGLKALPPTLGTSQVRRAGISNAT